MGTWTPEQWTVFMMALGTLATSIIAAVKAGQAKNASDRAEDRSAFNSERLNDIHTQTNGTFERQLEITRGLRTALAEEKMRSSHLQAEVVRRADAAMPPTLQPPPEK